MPNLYKLSRAGVRFTNHFTAASACTPARGTLLTGLYAHQTWMCLTITQRPYCTAGLQPALQTAFPTWGKLLQTQGYQTAWCGKWHLSYPTAGIDGISEYGFEQLVYPDPTGASLQGTYGEPSAGYLNDMDIATAATNWLQQRSPGQQPWCLAVSFVNPHDQEAFWGGTEFQTYDNLFSSTSLTAMTTYGTTDNPPVVPWSEDALRDPPSYGYPATPTNWESGSILESNKPSTQLVFRNFSEAMWGGITDDPTEGSYQVVPYPGVTPEVTGIGQAPFSYWQRGPNCYTYLCKQVDDRIGEVLGALPADVAANTVVVFTSDHGEYAGAHGFVAGKIGTVYDEAYHVPLVVMDPTGRYASDVATPRTGLTSSVDMLPMLMGIATGGTGWMTGDNQLLYGTRLDMLAMLGSANAPGRPWVAFTTDEVMPAYYNPDNAPLHVTGLRTADAKLGTYGHWLAHTTTPAPIVDLEIEYYDYANPGGQLELDSTPSDPRAAILTQYLNGTVVPTELEAPLPASLLAAQSIAQDELLAVVAIAASSRSPSSPSLSTCPTSSIGPGPDF